MCGRHECVQGGAVTSTQVVQTAKRARGTWEPALLCIPAAFSGRELLTCPGGRASITIQRVAAGSSPSSWVQYRIAYDLEQKKSNRKFKYEPSFDTLWLSAHRVIHLRTPNSAGFRTQPAHCTHMHALHTSVHECVRGQLLMHQLTPAPLHPYQRVQLCHAVPSPTTALCYSSRYYVTCTCTMHDHGYSIQYHC